jgi:hypothetical protein
MKHELPSVRLSTAIITVLMFVSLTINIFMGLWIRFEWEELKHLRYRYEQVQSKTDALINELHPDTDFDPERVQGK